LQTIAPVSQSGHGLTTARERSKVARASRARIGSRIGHNEGKGNGCNHARPRGIVDDYACLADYWLARKPRNQSVANWLASHS